MNLNKVFIIGRTTADIQLRTTPSGQSVATFSVATNRTWTAKSGGKEEETEFHTIVAWGKTAEVASKFLMKGSIVLVEGRLRTRGWQDKQGQTRKTTEIVCERLQLGPRPNASTGSGPSGGYRSEGPSKTGNASAASSSFENAPPLEDLPVIDLESEDIKAEDLPF